MKSCLVALTVCLLVIPATAAPSRVKANRQTAEITIQPADNATAEEDAGRWILKPGQQSEPRSEEYNPSTNPQLEVNPPTSGRTLGQRLDNLLTVGGVVVPLIAGLFGGAAAPKIISIFSIVAAAIQGRKKEDDPATTPPNSGGIDLSRLVKIIETLGPVIAAVKHASAEENKDAPAS